MPSGTVRYRATKLRLTGEVDCDRVINLLARRDLLVVPALPLSGDGHQPLKNRAGLRFSVKNEQASTQVVVQRCEQRTICVEARFTSLGRRASVSSH